MLNMIANNEALVQLVGIPRNRQTIGNVTVQNRYTLKVLHHLKYFANCSFQYSWFFFRAASALSNTSNSAEAASEAVRVSAAAAQKSANLLGDATCINLDSSNTTMLPGSTYPSQSTNACTRYKTKITPTAANTGINFTMP